MGRVSERMRLAEAQEQGTGRNKAEAKCRSTYSLQGARQGVTPIRKISFPDDYTFSNSAHGADILFSGKPTHGKLIPVIVDEQDFVTATLPTQTPSSPHWGQHPLSPRSSKTSKVGPGEDSFPSPDKQHLQSPGHSQLTAGLLNEEGSCPQELSLSYLLNNRLL